MDAVQLLIDHQADVNCQGKFVLQQKPIHGMAAFGAPCEVLAKMLELKADVLGGRGGLASLSPLHNVAYSGCRVVSQIFVAPSITQQKLLNIGHAMIKRDHFVACCGSF